MTPNELEAYDAMVKDRDSWKLTAAQVEQRCIALLKRHGVDVAGLAAYR